MSENTEAKPVINVTPLIDVLLVLLIIFMLISPLKPASFKANIPSESRNEGGVANINTLIVSVNSDYSLNINNQKEYGTIADPANLIGKLSQIFKERTENGVFRNGSNEIEKTVFIKAPRSMPYGEVTKVVDAVKSAGASPIGLQIDKLD
jgi:biopolymer transport protein ExbD